MKRKKGITAPNEEEIEKTLQKKSYDKIRSEKREINEYTFIHRNLIGSKENKRTYNKKDYEKVKEEKRIKKEKEETVVTPLDEEDIIHYYHNHVSDDGGYISSDSCYSNNDDPDPSEPGSSGSSDSESGSGESEEKMGNKVDSEIYPRNCVGDPGEIFAPCPKCGALKLKPLLLPICSPGEISLKSLCCSDGRIYIEEEETSPAAKCILDLWNSESDYGRVFIKHA